MPVISAISGAWYGSTGVSATACFWGDPNAPAVTTTASMSNERRVARIFIVPTLSLIDHGVAADRLHETRRGVRIFGSPPIGSGSHVRRRHAVASLAQL